MGISALSGSSEVRVDDRGRVSVPARFVDEMRRMSGLDPKADDPPLTVVVTVDIVNQVAVYPVPTFERFVEHLNTKPQYNSKWNLVLNMVTGNADYQTVDKQGRVRVPKLLAERKGLSGEMVAMGVGDRVQLLTRAAWEKAMDEYEKAVKEGSLD